MTSTIPQVWLREAIEAAIGRPVHPLDATGEEPPYAVYNRTATVRDLVLDDQLGDPAGGSVVPPQAGVTVEVFANDYLEAWRLSAAIVRAVHGYRGGVIDSCVVVDEKDSDPVFVGSEATPTFVVELTLELRYVEQFSGLATP